MKVDQLTASSPTGIKQYNPYRAANTFQKWAHQSAWLWSNRRPDNMILKWLLGCHYANLVTLMILFHWLVSDLSNLWFRPSKHFKLGKMRIFGGARSLFKRGGSILYYVLRFYLLGQITSMTGLDSLITLKRLDLSHNRISSIGWSNFVLVLFYSTHKYWPLLSDECVTKLANLESLDLRGNAISNIDDISSLGMVRAK